ncbi:MAG: YajQ family cyclic di-GMP-binding protein [bacterium]
MPSFDIVSEVEDVDIRHGTENAARELETRFDFRGVDASITFDKSVVTLKAEADFQCQQMMDMLRKNLVKRGVDPNVIDTEKVVHSGKTFSQQVRFKQGIDQDMAKKIVKLLKESKMKVQASIQGDKVRVTGKKRDDLQSAIAAVKAAELGQPFQFNNFRD